MDAIALVCDFAEVVNGKLYIMGGGWTDLLAIRPLTFSLAARLEVPWDRTNTALVIEMRLVDQDGGTVTVDGNDVISTNQLEVGRPAGSKPGAPLAVPLAWTFQGLELGAGRYTFFISVQSEEAAHVSFNVHVPPSPN